MEQKQKLKERDHSRDGYGSCPTDNFEQADPQAVGTESPSPEEQHTSREDER